MSDCSQIEPFALQVTDDSMEPEFPKDTVIVAEPIPDEEDGRYVIADYAGDTWFRQLRIEDGGDKFLMALNDNYPPIKLVGPYRIRAVVIAQSYKGRRKKYIS
jgi:SOS-response transcriptional repressor LexA